MSSLFERHLGLCAMVVMWIQCEGKLSAEMETIFRGKDPVLGAVCSIHEYSCWKQGKLLHSDGRCYYPLERGPCQSGYWFILDFKNSIQGRCVKRLCSPRKFPLGGGCVSKQEARHLLCRNSAERAVYVSPFGFTNCGKHPVNNQNLLHAHLECDSTTLPGPGESKGGVVSLPGFNCAQNDAKECIETGMGKIRKPDLKPEE